ncbi:MAG TPA: serpin family protein, partial [Gemmatimonadaceae bacterium]|nr:serpin family protein [Gemmatimonadaceae bacterium]
MQRVVRLAFLVLALSLGACRDSSGPGNAPDSITALSRELTNSERALIAASDTFGVELLSAVNSTRRDANIFMSPLSVSIALGMAMNGAAGNTYDEMRSALGFGTLPQ